MRNYYLALLAFLLFFGTLNAQTYVSDTTSKQFITAYNQSFTFTFTGVPAGGFGTGNLVVYLEGDFGDSGESATVVDESSNTLGNAGPYNSGFDCAPRDSFFIPFNAANIDTWMADNQVDFTLTVTSNVDLGVCTVNYLQCRLVYDYCAAGTPQEFAAFSLSDSLFCTYDTPIALSGTPAGGTFSGTGVSGNTFNPSALAAGTISSITYTATDGIGCTTSFSRDVRIKVAPNAPDTVACPGTAPELMVAGGGTNVWFYDPALTQVVDTGGMVLANPITETTTYYVSTLNSTSSFVVNAITDADSAVVDHNATTGDDRGGIAITPDYLFVVGDNNTVRANAADLTGQVSLPIQDALFSNLQDGSLYTLWNTDQNAAPSSAASDIPVNAIRGLDINMALTADIYPLDAEIPVAYGSMILAGYGFVGIRSAEDNHVYIIDLDNYVVTDLGVQSTTQYGSENWASWGVLEYDGLDFNGVYRTNAGSTIVRHNFTTDVSTTVMDFPNGISDLASFTVSPWNDRWYFHYEGGSTTFGGSTETMGYAGATLTSTLLANNELGCYTDVEVFVAQIDLGNDTTICENSTPYVLFAGLGYNSYTWNGDNNNYNAFPVTEPGTYIVEVIDDYNCTITDTIQLMFDPCAGISELANAMDMLVYPNPTAGDVNLTIESDRSGRLNAHLYDLNGKVLLNEELQLVSGHNAFSINTKELNPGVYILLLDHETLGQHQVRIVKH